MEKKKALTIFIPLSLLVIVILVGVGVKFTSRPAFCANCHEIKPAVTAYENSAHKEFGVTCLNCHADKGELNVIKRKVASVGELYTHLTNAPNPSEIKGNVPGTRCLNCHSGKEDAPVKGTDITKFTGQLADIHSSADIRCAGCHMDTFHNFNKK